MASLDELQREQEIMVALESSGQVLVTELAYRFGVSAVTIRKNLDALERRSMLRRVRGGAVSVGTTDEGSFAQRLCHRADAKQAIARAAAPLVHSGEVIAMDASTTCFYLAHELLERRDLVVVTNGMRAASLFMEQSTAMVLMPGGVLRRSAGSMVGPIGDLLAGRGRIDRGFFGVVGLSAERGLMDIVAEEAQTKSYLAAACSRVYGLFDSSKAGRFALHSFAATSQVEALYTDDGIDPDLVGEWRELGVPTHAVAVDSDAGIVELPQPATGSRR